MLLVTYSINNSVSIGVLEQDGSTLIDLSDVDGIPNDMLTLIKSFQDPAALVPLIKNKGKHIELSSVSLLAPIPEPLRNIFCIGKNYRDHIKEIQSAMSSDNQPAIEAPIFFTKATTSVIGPDAAIPASNDLTQSTDYEGELGVIIGTSGKQISRDDALRHVFGYTIINDVTSRRTQKLHQQWFLGKSLDGFCPMGPAILTRDAVADPSQLQVQTRVNGELRQNGKVSDMIFSIAEIIEVLSKHMTLLPGDIIATGTPAGVGMGFSPPKFLQPGDDVSITIEPIGCLQNLVN